MAGKPIDKTRCEFAVWTGAGNSTGFTAPSVVFTPGERRDLWFLWEVPGFGKINIKVDNGTNGYGGPAGKGEVVNLNLELARSLATRAQMIRDLYVAAGIPVSPDTEALLTSAKGLLTDANSKSGADQARVADQSSNASLWALEGLETGRAFQGIEANRKGNVAVTVLDKDGKPIPGVNVTIDQVSHDFLFGVFDQLGEVGIDSYRKLKDIGVNYATAGFYWSITEPTEGNFNFAAINDTIGVPHWADLGLKIKAHANIYLLDLVLPEYVKHKTFAELNATVYNHVHTLVSMYKDDIDIWEIINEAHGTGANLGMTHEEILEIMKTGARAIHDADPTARTLVNDAFYWFAEQLSGGYFLEIEDDYTTAVHEFLDWLQAEGFDYDIVGQQMYDGGYSSFFEDAGIGPGMGASTFDMSFISEVLDALEDYGKPVHITEQSVSGAWNDSNPSWKDAGYLHRKWDYQAQAEFLTLYYTIVFSKPLAESITWWDVDDKNPFMKAGGLVDKDLQPKPIFYALRDFIANHTTKGASGLTKNDGTIGLRGYGGDYNITVSKGGKTAIDTVHITERTDKTITVRMMNYAVRPDLVINSSDISLNSSRHEVDGTVQVNVSIRNIGETTSLAFAVRALQGGNDSPVRIGPDKSIGSLDRDETARLVFIWNATNLSGSQNLTIVVDPTRLVNETNESNNNVTVSLALEPVPWGHVHGNVTAADTGAPIAGAAVAITMGPGQGTGTTTLRTETDAKGSFEFWQEPVGQYNIAIEKPDHHPYRSGFEISSANTTNLNISLEPIDVGTVVGTVKDGDGTPIPEASISIDGSDDNLTTNETGGFSISDIHVGHYNITASAKDHADKTLYVEVKGNRTISIDIVLLTILGNINGKVTDNVTDLPIENATISIPSISLSAFSLRDGTYNMNGVPEGEHSISITKAGYIGINASVSITAGKTNVRDFVLDPVPPMPPTKGNLHIVVKENGSLRPIKDAVITLDGPGGPVFTSDKVGALDIMDLSPGLHNISVSATNCTTKNLTFEIIAGNTTWVDVILDREKHDGGSDEELSNNNSCAVALSLLTVIILVVAVLMWFRRRGKGRGEGGVKKETDQRRESEKDKAAAEKPDSQNEENGEDGPDLDPEPVARIR